MEYTQLYDLFKSYEDTQEYTEHSGHKCVRTAGTIQHYAFYCEKAGLEWKWETAGLSARADSGNGWGLDYCERDIILWRKKTYNELFREYLDCVEFSIDKTTDEDGEPCYCLIDKQHANLGDIESDRFRNADEIFDRMGIYIDDYFLNDLDEEWGAYGMPGEAPETLDDWDKYGKENAGTDFVNLHQFGFDVIDMILHHADEIDLEKVVEMIE